MGEYDDLYQKEEAYFGTEADSLLGLWLDQLDPSAPVLDLGVGQGRNAWPLLQRGMSVVGVDPSAVAIDTVRRRARREELSLETYCGGVFDYPTRPTGRFGGVLCFGLLQLLPAPEIPRLVARFGSWLRPGGLLLLTAWTVDDPSYALASRWPRVDGANADEAITPRSFRNPDGEIRTYLPLGGGSALFAAEDWLVRDCWEGLGEEHRHGKGPWERHGELRLVAVSR